MNMNDFVEIRGCCFFISHTWMVMLFLATLCVQGSIQETGNGVLNGNSTSALKNLIANHDNKLRPYSGEKSIHVDLGLQVESLSDVSASTMDFSLTMFLREYWHDPRLANMSNTHIILKGNDVDSVWSPDIFFLHEKNAKQHDVTVLNKLIYIRPNGTIWMSMRVSATLTCHMSLEYFPMDSQTCNVTMMSYAYDTEEITLTLAKENVFIDKTELKIPRFDFLGHDVYSDTMHFSSGRNFSRCTIKLSFERQMQAYLLTVYIPSCLLVSIAWLSFWIDARAAPARITLGITTVLTITTMTSGILETLPIVTYAKAIDIWLAACLLFVFLCLLEYAWANYLVVLEQKRLKKRKSMKLMKKKKASVDMDDVTSENIEFQYDNERHWSAQRLDAVSRIAFPIAFAVFNLIYWPFYLHKGDLILWK